MKPLQIFRIREARHKLNKKSGIISDSAFCVDQLMRTIRGLLHLVQQELNPVILWAVRC